MSNGAWHGKHVRKGVDGGVLYIRLEGNWPQTDISYLGGRKIGIQSLRILRDQNRVSFHCYCCGRHQIHGQGTQWFD